MQSTSSVTMSPSLRRRHTAHPSPPPADSPSSSPSTALVPKPPAARPRSYSCHAPAPSYSLSSSRLLESLDLNGSIPNAWWNLRNYLMGRLDEAEEGVKALKKIVEESESESSSSALDDDEWEVVQRTKKVKGKRARAPPAIVVGPNLSDSTALSQFVSASTIFLNALRNTLPTLSPQQNSSSLPLVAFQLSPDARIALDHFLEDHPLPSFPQLPSLDLNLRARLGDGTSNAMLGAATLLARVSEELRSVQTVLTGLTGVGGIDIATIEEEADSVASSPGGSSIASSTSYMPSLPSAPLQLAVLRDYFSSESERLSSSLSSLSASLPAPPAIATESLAHLCEEATELSHLVMDATAKLLHAAAEKGMQGLLMYDDLPFDWRNNEHIHSGYRYIGIDRWGALVRSCFEWHNETVRPSPLLLALHLTRCTRRSTSNRT
jgi:hypothetical protein